jgi:hypothetical protein
VSSEIDSSGGLPIQRGKLSVNDRTQAACCKVILNDGLISLCPSADGVQNLFSRPV